MHIFALGTNMPYKLLMIIGYLFALSLGAKVKARFNYTAMKLMRTRVIMPEIEQAFVSKKYEGDPRAAWYWVFKPFIERLNASLIYTTDTASGSVDKKTGNYSGMIAIIARGEADVAFQALRPDSLKGEPVRIGPPSYPAEVIIVSAKAPPKKRGVEVTDVVRAFDGKMYMAIVTTLFISSVIIAVGLVREQDTNNAADFGSRSMIDSVIRKIVESIWSIFETIVGQENFQPSSWPNRVVWLHVCLSIFVVVFGIFLNFLSCDQIADQPQSEIDSIEDALDDPRFAQETPILFRSFWLLSLLKAADPATKLGRMYKRVKKSQRSLFDVPTELREMPSLLKRVQAANANRSEYLLIAELMYKRMALPMGCIVQTSSLVKEFMNDMSLDTFMSNWHISKEFGHGTLAYFYSKNLQGDERRMVDFGFRNLLEFAPLEHTMKLMGEAAMMPMLKHGYNHAILKCMEPPKKGGVPDVEFFPLKTGQLRSTFILLACGCGMSLIALIGEVLWLLTLKVAVLSKERVPRVYKEFKFDKPKSDLFVRPVHSFKKDKLPEIGQTVPPTSLGLIQD